MGPSEPTNGSIQLVVFVLDEQSYALHLPTVEIVVRGVEVTRVNHGLG